MVFHVDDLKCSHVDPSVNDEFLIWLNKMYGEMSEVKAHRGKAHDYLGMKLDYSQSGKVKIDMRDYVKDMLTSFPMDLNKTKAKTPADVNLFNFDDDDNEQLDMKYKEIFPTTVAKGIFLAKRGRPDIQTTNAYLSTKVQALTKNDWKKLI